MEWNNKDKGNAGWAVDDVFQQKVCTKQIPIIFDFENTNYFIYLQFQLSIYRLNISLRSFINFSYRVTK